MRFLSKMISFWNNLFRHRHVERDLNDELQAYVEEMAERKIQAGLAPEVAREAALLELGSMERVKDLVRQQRVGLGNLRTAGVAVIIAVIAFISGASAALGAMHWKNPQPATPKVVSTRKEPIPAGASFPHLEGRIVDKTTGEPISFAQVRLHPRPCTGVYTFTDIDGRFRFLNPPAQGYRLAFGGEQWTILGFEMFPYDIATQSPTDYFHLNAPTDIVVRGKDEQPIQGEPLNIRGVLLENGKRIENEFRRFHYSTSLVELQAETPTAGKSARK